VWEWIRKLFRRRPEPIVWRVKDDGIACDAVNVGPPPTVKVDKGDPYKRKGWVNFLIAKETVDALGKTSAKEGVSPKVVVRALFEMFEGWSEADKKAFCWNCLLAGVQDAPQETIEDQSLEELEMKAKLQVEQLEARECPAVTASFAGGVLTVVGDNAANQIVVDDADLDGAIEVTDGGVAVAITGGAPLTALTSRINISTFGGDDTVSVTANVNVRDANGVLVRSPDTQILLGAGDDYSITRNGGIVGGLAGVVNGLVVGPVVGNSFVDAGSGNDFVDSGLGNDTIFLGVGNDTYRWLPGTLTDFVDGGKGRDVSIIVGNSNQGDVFNLSVGADGILTFSRTNLIQFQVFHTDIEGAVLMPGSGDDTVNVGTLDGSGVQTVTIDGGDGADTINVAAQRQARVTVVADPADLVNLDAAFASLPRGPKGRK
jgi:hypothetical protein